jgi:GATA-binding protein
MYAKTKATLPHAQRMENITWRMMALALKKRKEDEESKARPAKEEEAPLHDQALGRLREAPPVEHKPDHVGEPDERGRRIDKGKAKVRVEGFDGTSQDSFEEEEYVPSLSV